MTSQLNYLDHVARESASFADAISGAAPGAAVPSCPDWVADDLLWHLAEVQWFWGTIVHGRLSDPSAAEAAKPQRPADRDALTAFYRQASRDLLETLTATSAETEVWTWSDDHSVSFIRRRQAHEALVHRIDAELTGDTRTPIDSALAADGVDEVLRVMYGGSPAWGAFQPDDGKTVRLHTTDTGDSWVVRLGRFTGTDPSAGTSYDEPELRIDDADVDAEAAASVAGTAADLDCWLWHRETVAPISRSGDEAVLAELDRIIAPGID